MTSSEKESRCQLSQQVSIHENQQLKLQKQSPNKVLQVNCNQIIIKKQSLRSINYIQQICSRKQIKIDLFKLGNYLENFPMLQNLQGKKQKQLANLFQRQTNFSIQKIPNMIKQQVKKLNTLYKIFESKVLLQKSKQSFCKVQTLQKQDVKNFIFKKVMQNFVKLQNMNKSQIVYSVQNKRIIGQKIEKVIQKIILKIEKQIFLNSILAIQQLNIQSEFGTKCKIYLQQCYNPIIEDKNQILKVLGEKRYNSLTQIFLAYSVNNQQNKSIYQFYKLCHYCSKSINVQKDLINQKSRCKYKLSSEKKQQIYCTYFYPQLYYQRKFSSNFKTDFQENKMQIIPYFFSQLKQYTGCRRFMCGQCIKLNKKNVASNCEFCEGICSCKRCVLADKLSKILSYWSKGKSQKIVLIITKFLMNS